MNCRKSVCMAGSFDASGESGKLRHAEVLQGIGQSAGQLIHVAGEGGVPRDVGVDAVGGHLALLLRRDDLLLEKRGKEFVRVLNRAQRKNVGGVDLVEYGDFAVEIGIDR